MGLASIATSVVMGDLEDDYAERWERYWESLTEFQKDAGYLGEVLEDGSWKASENSRPQERPEGEVSGESLELPDGRKLEYYPLTYRGSSYVFTSPGANVRIFSFEIPTGGYFTVKWFGGTIRGYQSAYAAQYTEQWYYSNHLGAIYHYVDNETLMGGSKFYWEPMDADMTIFPEWGALDEGFWMYLEDFPQYAERMPNLEDGEEQNSWVWVSERVGVLDRKKTHGRTGWQKEMPVQGWMMVSNPHEPGAPIPSWYYFTQREGGEMWLINVSAHPDGGNYEDWVVRKTGNTPDGLPEHYEYGWY